MSFIGDLFKSGSSSSNTIDPQIKQLLMNNYSTAQGVANTPFQPYTGDRVAPFTPTQMAGQEGLIGAANNPTGTNTINNAAGVVNGVANYSPADVQKWMNPYTDSVVSASLGDLSHAYDQTKVADNASATAAHAFGGTRQAVQRANTTDDYLRNVSSTSANLRNAGFNTAVQAGQGAAGLRLNAGNSLAKIGDTQLLDALKRAGVIQSVGDQQQQQQQNVDNSGYEEFLRQINYPKEQQDIRNSALGFLPKDNTQTTTNSPSPLSMIGSVASIAAPFFSDERTKENITTAGYDKEGRRWVDFNYKWDNPSVRRRGVIAQEVLKTDPAAVTRDPITNYLMVDYSKLETR